nr:reverse transcriptase domain-containing protein [Tanacetum cinerariifolium]
MVLSKTIVHTDHSALRHLFKKQDAKPRLIRWIQHLQEFDIKIKDRKSIENVAAVHLSRIENDKTSDDSEVDDNFPGETLMEIDTKDEPWFADFANYLRYSAEEIKVERKKFRASLSYRNACSKVFTRDIYGDHVISCVGIIGIKHRHNVVRDTLVNICFRSGISAEKEVDIGLGGGWSSPLTQTGMVDFVLGRAITDAARRKRVNYEAKCEDIRYGFLPFFFYAWGIREGCSDPTETGMVDFVLGRAITDAARRKRVNYEAKCEDIRYGFLPFFFYAWGIREGCSDPTEVDPKVLYDRTLGHVHLFIFLIGLVSLLLKE